jgi:hypothetical protein
MRSEYSEWYRWPRRNAYPGIDRPGVYAIAICDRNIAGRKFSMREEVVYVGMTIAGLKGRLKQFDKTIAAHPVRRYQHGGAQRFLLKHQDYEKVTDKMYVALCHFEFDPYGRTPSDLRGMGRVANLEFEMMAQYAERFHDVPEFNRMESKKFKESV